MKQKDLKISIRMHELALRYRKSYGHNPNSAQLCMLDNSMIKQLIDEGYSLSEIHKEVTKVFERNKKRYNILKKFIEDFDKNNKLKK